MAPARPGPGQESESESKSKLQTTNSDWGPGLGVRLRPGGESSARRSGKNLCSRWGRSVRRQLHFDERRKERAALTDTLPVSALPISLAHTYTQTQRGTRKEFLLIKCVIIAQKYTPTKTTRKSQESCTTRSWSCVSRVTRQ